MHTVTTSSFDGYDLEGRCILLVGGRLHHASHIRQIVESHNGIFVHHDGGMENNLSRLTGCFRQADAVFFPVDCVSHAAQNKVKQLCRQWNTPYYPLRSSGTGSFSRALELFAANPILTSQIPPSKGDGLHAAY